MHLTFLLPVLCIMCYQGPSSTCIYKEYIFSSIQDVKLFLIISMFPAMTIFPYLYRSSGLNRIHIYSLNLCRREKGWMRSERKRDFITDVKERGRVCFNWLCHCVNKVDVLWADRQQAELLDIIGHWRSLPIWENKHRPPPTICPSVCAHAE